MRSPYSPYANIYYVYVYNLNGQLDHPRMKFDDQPSAAKYYDQQVFRGRMGGAISKVVLEANFKPVREWDHLKPFAPFKEE